MRRVGEVTLPVYVLDERQFTGLRQQMLSLDDGTGEPVAAISAGAGLGTPYVWIELNDDSGKLVFRCIDARDLLRAAISLFKPPDAENMLKALE